MTTRDLMHEDYAEEAEAAERAEAWPQAAALWRRAAETASDARRIVFYQDQAARCDGEVAVDQELASIARRVLGVPTLEPRSSDRLDFHELGVWQIREVLRLAYRAGRDAR